MKILIPTNNLEKIDRLVKSLKKHKWDYEILYKEQEWKNRDKLFFIRDWLKENKEDFILMDGFDTVVLDTPENTLPKLNKLLGNKKAIIGVEANCWTGTDYYGKQYAEILKDKHPKTDSPLKYVNSGLYFFKRDYFLELTKTLDEWKGHDDQGWLMNEALKKENIDNFVFDDEAVLFLNMIDIEDQTKVENNKIKFKENYPVFIHYNGTPYRNYKFEAYNL